MTSHAILRPAHNDDDAGICVTLGAMQYGGKLFAFAFERKGFLASIVRGRTHAKNSLVMSMSDGTHASSGVDQNVSPCKALDWTVRPLSCQRSSVFFPPIEISAGVIIVTSHQ